MRVLLGLIFVVVGLVWWWRIRRTYRQDPKRGTLGVVFDFVSGYPIDVLLIVALLVLGALLIAGHWLKW
jgi:hypothetical protein